ncbi:hypothetical protein [Streptomyces sp. NPDC051211]|uniref:hypothetical protein n=1 Tax=Streptomyces sp. NPDC051211 TaxID=3154643 RepID=UPI00344C4F2C
MPKLMRHLSMSCCGLIALTGCAASSTASGEPDTGPTTQMPAPTQHRDLTCGKAIDPPLSDRKDPLSLTITGVEVQQDQAVASWSITSSDPNQILTVPIGPTPPTAVLMRGGSIVGTKKPTDAEPRSGAALGYPVGSKPYTGTLKIDHLCPGTSWADVAARPNLYTVFVITSDPAQKWNASEGKPMPTYFADPLFHASHQLPG